MAPERHAADAEDVRLATGRARRRFGGGMVATVVLAAAVLGGAAAPAAAGCTAPGVEIGSEAASSFVGALNDMRRARGLSSLVVNDRISEPAVAWSVTMSAADRLYHARDTGSGDGVAPAEDYVRVVGAVVADWRRVGENVGVSRMTPGCTTAEHRTNVARVVRSLHDAFAASPGHLANMVGDYNQVGVGVHIDPDQLWVTVRFAHGSIPVTHSAARSADVDGYLDAVHQLFVARDATAREVEHWAPSVWAGRRSDVTNALAVSDEWAGVRISQLYELVLDRPADPDGRRHWVATVRAGTRLEDVAAEMFGSAEYFLASGRSHDRYVRNLYRDVLDRAADPAGLADWRSQLDSGRMSRRQVAAHFYASIESRRDRVDALYREILSRPPDPAGLAHWSAQLTSLGDVVLAATLASSTEFWNRATT